MTPLTLTNSNSNIVSSSVFITSPFFKMQRHLFNISKPFGSFCHTGRVVRWESLVINWGVCLDRLDKYFFCRVVFSPQFLLDSLWRSWPFKLCNVTGWLASLKHATFSWAVFLEGTELIMLKATHLIYYLTGLILCQVALRIPHFNLP